MRPALRQDMEYLLLQVLATLMGTAVVAELRCNATISPISSGPRLCQGNTCPLTSPSNKIHTRPDTRSHLRCQCPTLPCGKGAASFSPTRQPMSQLRVGGPSNMGNPSPCDLLNGASPTTIPNTCRLNTASAVVGPTPDQSFSARPYTLRNFFPWR